MAHSRRGIHELLQTRWRRKGVEVAVAALEHRRRPAHTLSRQQRALQPELAGAAEMQALGVAAAPRELEQARARRARDAQRVGQPRRVESVELAHRRGRTERPLRSRIVKAAHRLEAHRRARDSRRDLEAEG